LTQQHQGAPGALGPGTPHAGGCSDPLLVTARFEREQECGGRRPGQFTGCGQGERGTHERRPELQPAVQTGSARNISILASN